MTNAHSAFDSQSTRSFYDRISHAYDLISDAGEGAARSRGVAELKLQPGEAVLDIGYGTGSAAIELARGVLPGGAVRGIDLSPGMQKVALRKVAADGLSETITLDVGSALTLPYEDAAFDAAFTSFTLELFPDQDIPTFLAEAQRVLKPGGRLGVVAMATSPAGMPDSLLEKTYKWTHRHFPHIVDCRPIDVEAIVARAGFQITSDVRTDIFTMPVAIVVAVRG